MNKNTTKKVNIKRSVNLSGNAIGKKINITADAKNINQVTNLMVDLIQRKRQIWRKELNDWHTARWARYNTEIPKTYPMQELYDDIILDGHLTGITEDRTFRSINKKYIFSVDEIKNDDLTDFIKDKRWFENTIQWAHESAYYGYSLLWVKEFEQGNIKEVVLVPRGLVVPERNCLLKDYNADTGLDYTDAKYVLWYAQFYGNIGLFEKAAVLTILKRHSWGSWDEFEELFGVPIRIAKIASQSETVKNEVAGWLEEMGSSAFGVFPLGTEIDIKESVKTDSFNVFMQKISSINSELSKLVKHETMTTDNGSSRSQSETHADTFENVVYADEKKMLSFLNDTIVPAMRMLGYQIPDNARISVEKTTIPSEQIEVDGVLLSAGYVLTKNYIERTYGVEIENMPNSQVVAVPPKESNAKKR